MIGSIVYYVVSLRLIPAYDYQSIPSLTII